MAGHLVSGCTRQRFSLETHTRLRAVVGSPKRQARPFTRWVLPTTVALIAFLTIGAPAVAQAQTVCAYPTCNFGNVPVGTTSAPQLVTVSNPGPDFQTIWNIQTGGDFHWQGCFGAVLAPVGSRFGSTSCQISVTFSPTNLVPQTSTLYVTFTSSGGGGPYTQAFRNLQGTGIRLPTAATPTFSLPGGTYTGTQSVALSDTTPGNVIHCTTDGSTPTASSPTCSTISVSTTETIKAIATASSYQQSAVASAAYDIQKLSVAATPTFSLPGGTYTGTQSVTLSDTTPGAVIHCTTDGSTPTLSSPVCSAISVGASETVQAIAGGSGYQTSPISSTSYTILQPVATPIFSPPPVGYIGCQSATLTDSTPGATIYYTTDGSTPTLSSTQYTAPIMVCSNETIRAIAGAPGYAVSALASASYTVLGYTDTFPAPNFNPFWRLIQQFGVITPSTAGAQFTSASGGQREMHLSHGFTSPTKGSVGVYFYDMAPGQQTLYEDLVLSNSSQPSLGASIGTQDFDANCYAASFSDKSGKAYGQNANCGIYPQLSTTSVARTQGWHYLSVIFWPGSVSTYIDGQTLFTVYGDYTFDTIDLKVSGPSWRPNTVAYFGSFSFAP
jgi:Fn3 associated/Chitobiase/beta-hexosaminidase C-terminal domain